MADTERVPRFGRFTYSEMAAIMAGLEHVKARGEGERARVAERLSDEIDRVLALIGEGVTAHG